LFFSAFRSIRAPGRPSEERAVHLFHVEVPMLFVQGTRDRLADLGLLEGLMERLGPRASLRLVQGADHSFRVPARADAAVKREMTDLVAEWTLALISRRS
jgi:predicted alpha/beta-hydrolase family hydrolase